MDYDDGKLRVRKSTKADAYGIAVNMRQSDRNEIWASNHLDPIDALKKGIELSVYCRTIENGKPIAMFGICPRDILGTSATIWMLATDDLNKINMRFLRHSKEFVNAMLDYYEYLENYVDVRNQKSIEWLTFLGAKFDEPAPYGVEGKPFQHFSFTKGK